MERRLLPQSVTKIPFLLNEIYDLGHDYATHNLGLWQSNFLFQFGEQSSSEESRGRQGPNYGKRVLVHLEAAPASYFLAGSTIAPRDPRPTVPCYNAL